MYCYMSKHIQTKYIGSYLVREFVVQYGQKTFVCTKEQTLDQPNKLTTDPEKQYCPQGTKLTSQNSLGT